MRREAQQQWVVFKRPDFTYSHPPVATLACATSCRLHHWRTHQHITANNAYVGQQAAMPESSPAVDITDSDLPRTAPAVDIDMPDMGPIIQLSGDSPQCQPNQDSPDQPEQQHEVQQAEQPPTAEGWQEQPPAAEQQQQAQQQAKAHVQPPRSVLPSAWGFAVQAANLRALQAGLVAADGDAEAQQRHRRCLSNPQDFASE
jgi:hypothetical protein